MLTTQIQVLLYLGNTQIVSCSVFVPIPAIVVKSHQTLEAILPYLPLSLTSLSASDPKEGVQQQLLPAPDSTTNSSSDHHALARSSSSTSLILSARTSHTDLSRRRQRDAVLSPAGNNHSHNPNHSHNHHGEKTVSSNRISPDSSIPATTCIKISLQPTPSFRFVKPKCPHLHQKNRNQRHLRQQQAQQQAQQPSSHPHQSHSHSHHPHHSHSHLHSHSSSRSHRPSTSSGMASLEYPQQTPSDGTVSVKFFFPASASTSAATEVVQVTGSFNAWQRTEPLTRNHETCSFEGEYPIALDSFQSQDSTKENDGRSRKRIVFKFVLDGSSWVTDPEQELLRDQAGNLNNVVFLDTLITSPVAIAANETNTPQSKEGIAATTTAVEESGEERISRQEEEDDAIIRQLGGGMWGAPYFAVNDPADLPEHFASTTDAEQDEVEIKAESAAIVVPLFATADAATPAAKIVAHDTLPALESVSVPIPEETKAAIVQQTSAPKEDEDEDDKIIRELGGGMWGTPFFKVNDPVDLPEHFVEALTIGNPDGAVTVLEKDAMEGDIFEGEVLKDEVLSSVTGKLIETVVETTEDTVIEGPDGTFLEESITTSVQDTVSGELEESLTEVIETVEEVEPALAETASSVVAEEIAPGVTMTEIESTIQGDDGVETTVVEDTITFTDGPEVEADSLHKLTTAIKPIQRGESFYVEQLPEVTVEAPSVVSTTTKTSTSPVLDAAAGDAKPKIDESVDHSLPASVTASKTNSSTSGSTYTQPSSVNNSKASLSLSVHGDDHDGDGDYGVVLLQGQPIMPPSPSNESIKGLSGAVVGAGAGDSKPTVDLSAAPVAAATPMPGLIKDTKGSLPPPLPVATTFASDVKVKRSPLPPVPAPLSNQTSSATISSSLVPASTNSGVTSTSTSTSTTAFSEKTEKSEKRNSIWKKIKKALK